MALPVQVLSQIRENIKEAEAAIKDLDIEIDKARRGGLNVDDMQKQATDLKAQVRQLKSVYGGK